jgi:hypothetical protein
MSLARPRRPQPNLMEPQLTQIQDSDRAEFRDQIPECRSTDAEGTIHRLRRSRRLSLDPNPSIAWPDPGTGIGATTEATENAERGNPESGPASLCLCALCGSISDSGPGAALDDGLQDPDDLKTEAAE